jgi:hypothetical protein
MQRELFGGAFTMAIEPRFVDCSQFRPIPDTQEVFSDAASDQSVIVEILEMPTSPEHAAEFHFGALASDNSAASATIFEVRPPEDFLANYHGQGVPA